MELMTWVILSREAKISVVLRKSLGSSTADSWSGGTLGLSRAQMMQTTSTPDCSELRAAATERCSTHICFLYLEGFKLNVLNNVAIAWAFELSMSLIDPRAEKTGPIPQNLYFQMSELKGAASKLFTFTQAKCPLQRRAG